MCKFSEATDLARVKAEVNDPRSPCFCEMSSRLWSIQSEALFRDCGNNSRLSGSLIEVNKCLLCIVTFCLAPAGFTKPYNCDDKLHFSREENPFLLDFRHAVAPIPESRRFHTSGRSRANVLFSLSGRPDHKQLRRVVLCSCTWFTGCFYLQTSSAQTESASFCLRCVGAL